MKYILDNCTSLRDEIMEFSNYKPKRKDKVNEDDKLKFEKVIKKMIRLNEIY